jgi:hypothetical protein
MTIGRFQWFHSLLRFCFFRINDGVGAPPSGEKSDLPEFVLAEGELRSTAGKQRTARKRQMIHISIWPLAIANAKHKEYGHPPALNYGKRCR